MRFLILPVLLSPGLVFASGLKVAHLSGEVHYAGKTPAVGQELPTGELLEVGSGGYIDLIYPEGHMLRFKDRTRVKLEGVKTAPPSVVQLVYGKVFAHFVKGRGAENIKLKTPAVIAGVRGTEFMLEDEPATGTYVCVCEGVVSVTGINAHQKDGDKVVKAGEDLHAKPGQVMSEPAVSTGMTAQTSNEFKAMGF